MKHTFKLGLAIFCFLLPKVCAEVAVAPKGLANTEGNSSSFSPFMGGEQGNLRYQFLYSGSEFVPLMQDGGTITELKFRIDGTPGGRPIDIVTVFELRLSTSPSHPETPSLKFRENIGADEALVFPSGSLRLRSDYQSGVVNPFMITIPLKTPFFYNPQAGNLLLDFTMQLGGGGNNSYFIDFDRSPVAGGIYGDKSEDSALNAVISAPVLQVGFTPVPEPSSASLFASLALVAAFLGKSDKKVYINNHDNYHKTSGLLG